VGGIGRGKNSSVARWNSSVHRGGLRLRVRFGGCRREGGTSRIWNRQEKIQLANIGGTEEKAGFKNPLVFLHLQERGGGQKGRGVLAQGSMQARRAGQRGASQPGGGENSTLGHCGKL